MECSSAAAGIKKCRIVSGVGTQQKQIQVLSETKKNPAVNDDVEMRIFKIFNNRNCFLPKEPATTTATTDQGTPATALQLSLRS